ncbi:hypothetical protein ABBQ32_000812 [Trebouxia sp. C0010 RCD-2024]
MVLHEFPMSKYGQYLEMKGEEMQLKREDVQLKEKGRDRAELEDQSSKRRRFDANTDDGITFRSLLAEAAEGSSDVKAFEHKARELSWGLEFYREFNQHVTGNNKPLQYNTEATDAIAKFQCLLDSQSYQATGPHDRQGGQQGRGLANANT